MTGVSFPDLFRFTLFLVLFFSLTPGGAGAHASVAGEGDPSAVRILFVGNSITHFHDLPGQVKRLVEGAVPGLEAEVEMLAPGGASLADHRSSGALLRLLEEENWDFVVLQERGLSGGWILDGESFQDPPDGFFAEVEQTVELVRRHGAEPVLYQTWGGSGAPEVFQYHDFATMEAGRQFRMSVAPVGRVWAELAREQGLDMLAPDGLHPSELATFAAAWTLASSLLDGMGVDRAGDAPGPEPSSMEEALARAVALRHASALTAAGGAERVERPAYRPRPALEEGDGPLLRGGTGVWRARDGGTRLSFGTEIRIEAAGEDRQVALREYTALGIVEIPAEILAWDDHWIEVGFRSSAVDFHLAAVRRGDALQVLTRRGMGQPREEFRTARYAPAGEDPWFDRLDELYAAFARDESERGLAEAIRRHEVRLRTELGDETILAARQGFDLGEWDAILTAWHFLHVGQAERALQLYEAGLELYPGSADIRSQYERALAELGGGADGSAAPRDPDDPTPWQEDLEHAWRLVDENYAYLDQKRTHWPSVRDAYRVRVAEVEDPRTFVNLLESMLGHLHDHHLHLGVSNDRSFRLVPSGSELWGSWQEPRAFVEAVRTGSEAERLGVRPGMEILTVDGMPVAEAVAEIRPRFASLAGPEALDWALRTRLAGRQGRPVTLGLRGDDGVREVSLSATTPVTREGRLSARRLEGNIGWIRIHDTLGDDGLIEAWDATLAQLSETRGLVLDLRDTPSGGNTTVARALMGRLISEVHPYQRHDLPGEERQTGVRRSWVEEVSPRGPFTYTAPVVVLADRWTGSMGEGVAIGLDGMGRALVLGSPMAGLAGAVTTFTLPQTGIELRIPTERLFHVDGTPREDFRPLSPEQGLARLDGPLRAAVARILEGG